MKARWLSALLCLAAAWAGPGACDEALVQEVQQRVASAWLLHAEGRHAEALTALRNAAEAEDRIGRSLNRALIPARELLGAMLLEHGLPAVALATFESMLIKEPDRYGAIAGAARAAELAGDRAKARRYRERLVRMTGG
jgi:tetratricopeptide (TPR) repeat protein